MDDDDDFDYYDYIHDDCHWCGTCCGYCPECDCLGTPMDEEDDD